MSYRTKTYIAADFDHDKDAVDVLYKWNDSDHWSLNFHDAHEVTQARDTSLPCSIKSSLKTRLDLSKRFVLIVGDHTDSITKGSCRYCNRYSISWGRCLNNRSTDFKSYIKYECAEAVKADMQIIVLYNDTTVTRSKCPEAVRYRGTHVAMVYYNSQNKTYYWNYQAVKKAFGL